MIIFAMSNCRAVCILPPLIISGVRESVLDDERAAVPDSQRATMLHSQWAGKNSKYYCRLFDCQNYIWSLEIFLFLQKCEIRYETVFEQQCTTVQEQQCSTVNEQECTTVQVRIGVSWKTDVINSEIAITIHFLILLTDMTVKGGGSTFAGGRRQFLSWNWSIYRRPPQTKQFENSFQMAHFTPAVSEWDQW